MTDTEVPWFITAARNLNAKYHATQAENARLRGVITTLEARIRHLEAERDATTELVRIAGRIATAHEHDTNGNIRACSPSSQP